MLFINELKLSNKKEIQFRTANETDAQKLWHLKRLLHQETDFLRLSPSEKSLTIEDEKQLIQQSLLKRVYILVAHFETELIAYLFANLENNIINKVTPGMLRKHTRLGIGKALIKNMEHLAIPAGITEIEMKVKCVN